MKIGSSRPVDQHYVPVGYLRGFVPDGEKALHVRRRASPQWFRQTPENIATSKNFYSVRREGNQWDDTLEYLLAELIEAPGIKVLRSLPQRPILSEHARSQLALFLAMQFLRTPQLRDELHGGFEKFLSHFSNHMAENVHALQSDIMKIEKLSVDEARRQAKKIAKLIKAGEIEARARPEASLYYMFSLLTDLAKIFNVKRWTICSSDSKPFCTGDRPIYVSPLSVEPGHVFGLADPSIAIHCPVSSRQYLMMSGLHTDGLSMIPSIFAKAIRERPPIINYRRAAAEFVRVANLQTCRYSREWVCAPEPSTDIDDALRARRIKHSMAPTTIREQFIVRQMLQEET